MCNCYFQCDDDDGSTTNLDSSSVTDVGNEKTSKVVQSRSKLKRKILDSDMSTMLSGAAESIKQLVTVVSGRKTEGHGNGNKELDDDDWLFCRRLYRKLRDLPDGPAKEYYKLTAESEILKLTFGTPNQCPPQPILSHHPEASRMPIFQNQYSYGHSYPDESENEENAYCNM